MWMDSNWNLKKKVFFLFRKALADQREMKLLLDLHKGASKDMREKAQILASEKKLRQEVEELKNQIKKMQDTKREDRKKMAEEDALKKIKQLEDLAHTLQKQVAAQKLVSSLVSTLSPPTPSIPLRQLSYKGGGVFCSILDHFYISFNMC